MGVKLLMVVLGLTLLMPPGPNVRFAEMGRSMRHEEESPTIEGKYANYFRVGHNAFEFILDFGQLFAETSQEQLHTRIITSPAYAKELRDSVQKHERTFGEVRSHGQQT